MLDVAVILLNDNYASTAIGPIEVFHSAGLLWNTLNGAPANPAFRVSIASLDGQAVQSPYALELLAQVSIRRLRHPTSSSSPPAASISTASSRAMARSCPGCKSRRRGGAHIAGICTGVAYLAEAGLLDGRQATTHWAMAETFANVIRRSIGIPTRSSRRPAHAVQRRRLCVDGPQPLLGREVLRSRGGAAVRQGVAHQYAARLAGGYAVLPLARPHDDAKVRTAEAYLQKNYDEASPLRSWRRTLA